MVLIRLGPSDIALHWFYWTQGTQILRELWGSIMSPVCIFALHYIRGNDCWEPSFPIGFHVLNSFPHSRPSQNVLGPINGGMNVKFKFLVMPNVDFEMRIWIFKCRMSGWFLNVRCQPIFHSNVRLKNSQYPFMGRCIQSEIKNTYYT